MILMTRCQKIRLQWLSSGKPGSAGQLSRSCRLSGWPIWTEIPCPLSRGSTAYPCDAFCLEIKGEERVTDVRAQRRRENCPSHSVCTGAGWNPAPCKNCLGELFLITSSSRKLRQWCQEKIQCALSLIQRGITLSCRVTLRHMVSDQGQFESGRHGRKPDISLAVIGHIDFRSVHRSQIKNAGEDCSSILSRPWNRQALVFSKGNSGRGAYILSVSYPIRRHRFLYGIPQSIGRRWEPGLHQVIRHSVGKAIDADKTWSIYLSRLFPDSGHLWLLKWHQSRLFFPKSFLRRYQFPRYIVKHALIRYCVGPLFQPIIKSLKWNEVSSWKCIAWEIAYWSLNLSFALGMVRSTCD